MRTAQPNIIWLLILFFLLHACHVPASLEVSKIQTAGKPAASQPELSAAELQRAGQRLRAGTNDSLKLLRDHQGRVVSWMVIYNPPLVDKNKPDSELPEFGIKDLYAFQELAPGNNYYVTLAEVHQPQNIAFETYNAWYRFTPGQYGGNRSHPDPWIRDDGCRPLYKFAINGQYGGEIGEQRYTPGTFFFPRFASSGNNFSLRMDPYEVKFKVPSQVLQAFVNNQAGRLDIQVSKGEACDGTSPAFSWQDVQTKPTTNPNYYCDVSVQRDNIDPEERSLRVYEAEVKSLEEELITRDFSAQSFLSSASSNKGNGLMPLFKLNSAPIPSRCLPTPDPDEPYDPYDDGGGGGNSSSHQSIYFHDRVPISIPNSQLDFLTVLADGLLTRLNNLQNNYELIEDPDIKRAQLKLLQELRAGILSAKRQVISTRNNLIFICKDDKPSDCMPDAEIDIIYAGFNPDASVTVYGRINHADSDVNFQDLQADFLGDLEVIDNPTISSDEKGFFKLHYPNVAITDAFLQKIRDGSNSVQLVLPEVKLRVGTSLNFATQQRVPLPPRLGPLTPEKILKPGSMPFPPLIGSEQGTGQSTPIEKGIGYSLIYVNGQWIANCDGEESRCRKLLDALGYDFDTLKKRDSVAQQYLKKEHVNPGGWLINEPLRPIVTTLALPGRPLEIPESEIRPGLTHHMLLTYIDVIISTRPDAKSFVQVKGAVLEALSRWHMEPIFLKVDSNIDLLSFLYRNPQLNIPDAEFDNLIYERLPITENDSGVTPIRVIGELESKGTDGAIDALDNMFKRYRIIREMQDKGLTIPRLNSDRPFLIKEIVPLEDYLFTLTRVKTAPPLNKTYSFPEVEMVDPSAPGIFSENRGEEKLKMPFSLWFIKYKLLFLRLPESKIEIENIVREYLKIRSIPGYR